MQEGYLLNLVLIGQVVSEEKIFKVQMTICMDFAPGRGRQPLGAKLFSQT